MVVVSFDGGGGGGEVGFGELLGLSPGGSVVGGLVARVEPEPPFPECPDGAVVDEWPEDPRLDGEPPCPATVVDDPAPSPEPGVCAALGAFPPPPPPASKHDRDDQLRRRPLPRRWR